MTINPSQIVDNVDIYHPQSKNVWRISTVVIAGIQHVHAYSRVDDMPFLSEPVTVAALCDHLNAHGFLLADVK